MTTRGDLGSDDITGLSLSSQRIRPGDLYAALPGARAHGIEFAPAAIAAGAVAVLTDADGADAAGPLGVPLLVVERPRALLGRLSARVHGDPATAMRMIGVTGTQGKTTTTRLAESGLQRAGVRSAVDRNRRHPGGRHRREDRPDDAGGPRPARPVRDDARARRGRLRDGGVEPRAGAGPGRRGGVRRRRLHQPRARPPRLPRRRRGVLPGQGLAVHPRAGPAGPGQRRRRARPTPARGGDDPDAHVLADRPRRGLAGGGRRARGHRVDVHGARSRRHRGRRRRPAARRLQRRQRARRDRRGAPRPASTPAGWRPGSPPAAGCPGVSSGSTPARASSSSSTTPTSPTRSRPRSGPCGR